MPTGRCSARDAYNGVRLEGTGSIRKLVAGKSILDAATIERLTRLLAERLPPNAKHDGALPR